MQGTWEQREVTGGRWPCETLVKCLALSQFTQLLRKVPGISSEPPPCLKTFGLWENKHCLLTAWLRAPGDSEMSLAVLAQPNCWETGLQKHGAGRHAWALLKRGSRGAPSRRRQPLHGSTAARTTPPGPTSGTQATAKCPVGCHSRPALPPLALSGALRVTRVHLLSTDPRCPSLTLRKVSRGRQRQGVLEETLGEMTTPRPRDLCKVEAARAKSVTPLRWRRAGESFRASPQFSLWQVEGAQPESPHLKLPLQTTRIACSYSVTFRGSHHPPSKTPLTRPTPQSALPTAC